MKKTDHLPTFRKKKTRKKLLRGMIYFSPVLALFCLVSAIYIVSDYENFRQGDQQGINQESLQDSGTIIQAGSQNDEKTPENKQDIQEEENYLIDWQKHQQQESKQQLGHQELQEYQQIEQPIIPADDSTDIYITPRMKYTLEIYDARSRQLSSENQPIPNDMYGLNRVELEQYLVSLAEKENSTNLQIQSHYQVTVFSRRAFTVRQTITEKKSEYAIFLIAEEGWLTAYTGDRTEVYEELNIALGDFSLEQQAMLTQGIYMKTLADYYDFLETFSS